MNNKVVKLLIYRILLIISLSISLILCGEVIIRESFYDIYRYFYGNQTAFFILVSLISSLLTVLYMIFNNIGIATFILGLIYISLQIVNYYKFIIKGEYIDPFDINLINEAFNIITKFELSLSYNIIWALLCILCLIVITLIIKEKIHSLKAKIYVSMVSMLIMITSINIIVNDKILSEVGINISIYNTNKNYNDNGFIFTLINRAGKMNIKEPNDYNLHNIKAILDRTDLVNSNDIIHKPNIILIMSEAFTEITEFPDIKVSDDPTPYFRYLKNKFSSGNIITPVFGGLTSQVEYQVLTGNTTFFTGSKNIAYLNYIYEGFPSIVKVLNDIGYNSIAIHPYDKEFYSRNIAYEKLGFIDFITEESFDNPDRIRGYISDLELVKMIIKKYEENESDKPQLIHAVTMQNHGPYNTSSNNKHDIKVESELLNASNKNILSEYANLLKASDKALKYLVDYFEEIKEPTIIVMYGDHKPVLGDNFSVYKQLGLLSNQQNYKQYYDIYHTPFIIYDNFGLEKQQYSNIDSSYLGAIVLKNAGLNYDLYFNHLYNQMKNLLAINEFFYIDNKGQLHDTDDIYKDIQNYLDNLWLLQYDRIFGMNYIGGEKDD